MYNLVKLERQLQSHANFHMKGEVIMLGMTNILASDWSIGNALKALNESLNGYGKIIMVIIGVAMIIVGIYQVAKNLISHGKAQTNWFITIALIVVGGIFALSSGWETLGSFVKGSQGSVDQMMQGTPDAPGEPQYGVE